MTKKPEQPKEDAFIVKLEQKLTVALDTFDEPKDQNVLFANCIKFLATKYKIREGEVDGGSWFGEDD